MKALAWQLPRTVVVLGLVSLLNDTASEMVTPLLPIFLTATLGAGPAIVGLVEGLAEATSSVLKLISGRLADRGVRAKRLVLGGYSISNAARPLLGLATSWAAVLLLRFLDRVGKGFRTAPRDALIAGAAGAAGRGRAFGFHRSMDHAGAVLGPIAAFALLQSGFETGQVFLASVVPGIAVVALLLWGLPSDAPTTQRGVAAPLSWRRLDARLRGMIIAAGLLALASVPEAFIVLWASDAGLEVVWVPLVWAAASVAKMFIAMPAGILSDRLGRLPVLVGGWLARVLILLLLAISSPGIGGVWLLFIAYAGSLAITEPAERSLIGDHAAVDQQGTAFGLYHLASGLLVLPGAVLFGLVWERFNSRAAFILAALVVVVAASMMLAVARSARLRSGPVA